MTQKQHIINLLRDGRWHHVRELHQVCWRYGARLWDLRREGVLMEKRVDHDGLEEWRLAAVPSAPQMAVGTHQTPQTEVVAGGAGSGDQPQLPGV